MAVTSKQTIHFLITGGTIDSFYNGRQDRIEPNWKSVIPTFIRDLRLKQSVKFNVICMKDSREVDEIDRQMLARAIEESPCRRIIITHGTYTMAETARYLQKHLPRQDQTIILTGSLLPIKGFAPSDGPFNLGYCLSEVRHLKPGIYIGINAQIFDINDTVQMDKIVRFRSAFTEEKQASLT